MEKLLQFLDYNKFPLVTKLTETNQVRVYSCPIKLQVVILPIYPPSPKSTCFTLLLLLSLYVIVKFILLVQKQDHVQRWIPLDHSA